MCRHPHETIFLTVLRSNTAKDTNLFNFIVVSQALFNGVKNCKDLDRHTVTSKLHVVVSHVFEVVKVMMKNQHFAMTSDHWTSMAGNSYLAVTAHFINEQWELESLTLACREHKVSYYLDIE